MQLADEDRSDIVRRHRRLRDRRERADASVREHGTRRAAVAWEATHKLMQLKTKTLHLIIDLQFDMSSFSSRDAGPCEKLIQVQDLCVAIQLKFAAARDSIELVLETSKKSIPESIEAQET